MAAGRKVAEDSLAVAAASAALIDAGRVRAEYQGPGVNFPVYSPGFFPRDRVDAEGVEVLHLGDERDDAKHRAAIVAYESILKDAGWTTGIRILGAGKTCVIAAKDASA